MTCELQILSHACLLVKTKDTSIIVDPWLVGSSYWRSWWNFPKACFDENELKKVDAVLISHIHWDHWHGPTLKKFFKDKLIITCDSPNQRSKKDLKSIGIQNTKYLSHSKSTVIGDIKITFYNFGLFLTDSAIVIEAGGITILNANDAKIAGPPLKSIVKNHSPIDFALRSHSSANSRICYEIPSDTKYLNDDRRHYSKSFKLFMDNVQPKYAIPFASNHCHLTDDTFKFNEYISDPVELRNMILEDYKELSWDLKIMLPGSSWSSKTGFSLADHSCYNDKLVDIKNYKESVSDRLSFYLNQELNINIDEKLLAKFQILLRASRAYSTLDSVKLLMTSNNEYSQSFLIQGQQVSISDLENTEPEKGISVIVMPNVVFRDAVIKNMFQHAAISKRCRFIAYDIEDMEKLKKFIKKLERYELTGKITFTYVLKLLFSYIGRWRELYVYFYALYLQQFKGLEMYQIEEKVLETNNT